MLIFLYYFKQVKRIQKLKKKEEDSVDAAEQKYFKAQISHERC